MSVNPGELQRALTQSIREHWVLFLVEGNVLVVLGILAILIPQIASLAVAIFLGWLFQGTAVSGRQKRGHGRFPALS